MSNCKVSVIVPVWNVEQYLDKCLDSLVNQTLSALEIIVVNDGSPDNSQAIIDKYLQLYPHKIRSYIQENGGLSSARNLGLEHVTGEYIGFVDSDDWVDSDMYEQMYYTAKLNDYDIVCCGFRAVYEDSAIDQTVINNPINKFVTDVVAWNKIYKTDFWRKNNFKYLSGYLHEDVELFPQIFSATDKFIYLNDKFLYNKSSNINSITSAYQYYQSYKYLHSYEIIFTRWVDMLNEKKLNRDFLGLWFFILRMILDQQDKISEQLTRIVSIAYPVLIKYEKLSFKKKILLIGYSKSIRLTKYIQNIYSFIKQASFKKVVMNKLAFLNKK